MTSHSVTPHSVLLLALTIAPLATTPLLEAAAQQPNAAAPTRVCLAPASAQMATGNTTQAVDAVRETFTSYLTGPTISTAPLTARLASQAKEEARQAGCRFVLYTSVKHERKTGGGLLSKIAGGAVESGAYEIGGATSSAAGRAAAGAAAAAARTLATSVKAKDELTLDYRLEAADGVALVQNADKRKAKSDGEDLLTPLVERAAETIVAAVQKSAASSGSVAQAPPQASPQPPAQPAAPPAAQPPAQPPAGRTNAATLHACSLLSVDEVRKITGRSDVPDETFGDDPGQGLGGGSSCNFGGEKVLSTGDYPPRVYVVLVPAERSKEYFDLGRTPEPQGIAPKGAKVEPVSGVGDGAYMYADPQKPEVDLWVRGGEHTLVIGMELKPPATAESVKPTVVALAKAAVAKLQ